MDVLWTLNFAPISKEVIKTSFLGLLIMRKIQEKDLFFGFN